MKKRILKVTIIMIMLVLVYNSIVNALSFTATMTASSTTVAESKEFTVKIKVSNLDVGTSGINSLSGYLKYDKDIFEVITDSNIDGLNGWSPTYTADSEKITLYKSTFVKTEEEVFQVTFKTKTGVSGKTGKIEFTNIMASNTDAEIQAQNISTEITIGDEPENVANTTKNNSSIGLSNMTNNTARNTNTNNNTNTNTNTSARVNTNVANNSTGTAPISGTTNNTTPDTIDYAGAEDSIIYIMAGVIILAIVFYIKFERVNKEIR